MHANETHLVDDGVTTEDTYVHVITPSPDFETEEPDFPNCASYAKPQIQTPNSGHATSVPTTSHISQEQSMWLPITFVTFLTAVVIALYLICIRYLLPKYDDHTLTYPDIVDIEML